MIIVKGQGHDMYSVIPISMMYDTHFTQPSKKIKCIENKNQTPNESKQSNKTSKQNIRNRYIDFQHCENHAYLYVL